MSCIGPIARSVDDLSLLYAIIAGPDSEDTDVPPVPVEKATPVELRGLRIAVAPTFGNLPLEADIRVALEKLAKQLTDAGAVVDQPALPIANVSQDLARGGALVGMMLAAAQPNQKQSPTLADYMTALQQRDASIAAWDRFFEQWDALLCAPAVTSAFPHCEPGTPLTVNESTVDYWTVAAHTAAFNYTGNPAVVLPCGLNRSKLPIGVQVVGRRWNDSRLLAIAGAVAQLTGTFQSPP
jgi:amidase